MLGVNRAAVPNLLEAIRNRDEAAIVKHESLFAIGNMLDSDAEIKEFLTHPELIVAESAQVAVRQIARTYKSYKQINMYEQINILQNQGAPIPDRMQALSYLRKGSSQEAIEAVFQAFREEKKSDLLKHEMCYSLGQMNLTQAAVDMI